MEVFAEVFDGDVPLDTLTFICETCSTLNLENSMCKALTRMIRKDIFRNADLN
jgi:hypothetical protein